VQAHEKMDPIIKFLVFISTDNELIKFLWINSGVHVYYLSLIPRPRANYEGSYTYVVSDGWSAREKGNERSGARCIAPRTHRTTGRSREKKKRLAFNADRI
jgi:hypothetical protein